MLDNPKNIFFLRCEVNAAADDNAPASYCRKDSFLFLVSYEFYRSSVEEINRHFFDQ